MRPTLIALCLVGAACVLQTDAATERLVTNLFVTDSPAYPGPTATVAGEVFVNNFLLTDYDTNATVATELGFCVAVRTPGPAQCLYTLTFATGTLQAGW